MRGPIYRELTPVHRRQRWLLVLRTTIWGLLLGSLAGIALGLVRWLSSEPFPGVAIAAVIAAGPVLGFLIGLLWKRSWGQAAAAVDQHYGLKDRAATALTFLNKPSAGVMHQLQVEDAARHLSTVDANEVMPVRMPVSLAFAGGALLIALALLLWPNAQPAVEAGPPDVPEHVKAQADQFQKEDFQDLEEQTRANKDKELKDLLEALVQKAEEMKLPPMDEKEAMAKISEMEAMTQAAQAVYNTAIMEAALQSLGEAFQLANETEGAGKALIEAKLDKAAEELEKLEDPEFDRKEAKALEEKLKKVATAMGECGLGALSQSVSELAEGVKGGKGQFKKATKEIAKAVRETNRRRNINRTLATLLERFKEGKCNCQGGGGQQVRMPYKSRSPSSSWGREISGNVVGNKTNLLSQRNLEQITGNPDDGPSEVETQHSTEARQQAARAYRDVYQKYRRMSEAVLDSEPIPLGHRQTIRKYFELIRPQQGDLAEPVAQPSEMKKKEPAAK